MSGTTKHLSSEIRREVDSYLGPSEEVVLLTDTDIDKAGSFGQRWLVVTSERVMVFSADGRRDGPDTQLRLTDIEKATAVHPVGQMALEVEGNGRKTELLRCTNSLSGKFAKIAKSLTDACKDGKTPIFELEEEEERICPQCGRCCQKKGVSVRLV